MQYALVPRLKNSYFEATEYKRRSRSAALFRCSRTLTAEDRDQSLAKYGAKLKIRRPSGPGIPTNPKPGLLSNCLNLFTSLPSNTHGVVAAHHYAPAAEGLMGLGSLSNSPFSSMTFVRKLLAYTSSTMTIAGNQVSEEYGVKFRPVTRGNERIFKTV